ncbi:hypothetical protein [Psychroserpens sp.]
MTPKTVLLALLTLMILSCSSDDNDTEEITLDLSEVFKLTIDKDTANEIVVNFDDPDSQSPCVSFGFTAPNTTNNGIEISNLSFFVPGEIIVNLDSIQVGETVPNYDLGPLEWGFTITIDGIAYEASAGAVSFSKYDESDRIANGGPILISGVLDVVVTEIGGSETRTTLINFENVQVSFVGAC